MATEIASLYASVGADISGFKRGLGTVNSDLRNTNTTLGKFTNAIGFGLKAAAGVGISAVVGLGGAIFKMTGQAASMQQSVADITADLGLAGGEIEDVRDLINDLGLDPNLKVNATEAADAIHMLGKNGLSLTQIMSGAARSTVLLANSTGSDFSTAADIATDVMAQFKVSAEDMMDVVNGITGTTRNSKFGINDYRLALAQAGGVASSVGVEFDDFNATIAAISPLFASGSDAGTSFKTFLQTLVPKSNDAAEEMQKLGIITADGSNQFFDAAGNMKSMAEIAGILQTAFSGLTEEQKNNAASTIFGTDAMRAAFALADAGSATIDDLKAKIGNTDAEEAAAIRMATLGGQWEIFRGIVDALAVKIGTAFLPAATKLVEWASVMANQYGPALVQWFGHISDGIAEFVDWLLNMGRSGQEADSWLSDLIGVLKSTATGVADFASGFVNSISGLWSHFSDFFAEINALFRNTPIAQVWKDLWLQVKRTLLDAWMFMVSSFGNMLDVLTGSIRIIRGILSGDWTLVWSGLKEVAAAAGRQLVDTLSLIFGDTGKWGGILVNAVKSVVNNDWVSVWNSFRDTAVSVANSLGESLRGILGGLGTQLADMLVNPLKYAINRFIDAHNLFIRTANMSLGLLPGGFTIPEIPTPFPGYAMGGRVRESGFALVGERGPELVDLPGGSYVHNARDTASMLGGSRRLDIYLHGDGTTPSDRDNIRKLARELQKELILTGAKVAYAA